LCNPRERKRLQSKNEYLRKLNIQHQKKEGRRSCHREKVAYKINEMCVEEDNHGGSCICKENRINGKNHIV
jgi:hypothetical protein